MPEVRKILGQQTPAAVTQVTLYTVTLGSQAVVSSIIVCNRSATSTTYRLSVAYQGLADATNQQIVYDATIIGSDSVFLVTGLTLGSTDLIRCYSTSGNVTFSAFGVEIT